MAAKLGLEVTLTDSDELALAGLNEAWSKPDIWIGLLDAMLKLLLVRCSDGDTVIVVEDDPATRVNNAGDIGMLEVTNGRNDSARRDKANIIALFTI